LRFYIFGVYRALKRDQPRSSHI